MTYMWHQWNGDISQQTMPMDVHFVLPDKRKTKGKRNPQFCNDDHNTQENILKIQLDFHLTNTVKRKAITIGKSKVAHESYLQKKNQMPK